MIRRPALAGGRSKIRGLKHAQTRRKVRPLHGAKHLWCLSFFGTRLKRDIISGRRAHEQLSREQNPPQVRPFSGKEKGPQDRTLQPLEVGASDASRL